MKLWIDDIRTPPDDSWHICRSVLSAIRALSMYYKEIEEITLDHDISHQVVLGKMSRPYPCEETFEAVAWFVAKLKRNEGFFPKITLHTSNPIGADKMKAILNDVGLDCERRIVGGANRLEMNL